MAEMTDMRKFKKQGKTKTVHGSISMPELSGLRLVLVLCSLSGKPDGDVYSVLTNKWKNAAADLKGWHQYQVDYKLGNIKETCVQSDVWLLHTLCLKKDGTMDDKALDSCLKKIAKLAKDEKASVHISAIHLKDFPGLNEKLGKALLEDGVTVYVYEEQNPIPASSISKKK